MPRFRGPGEAEIRAPPETSGSYTDTFQLNSFSSLFFGPTVTVQVVVMKAGSTNQYDRGRAVSYANNYSAYGMRLPGESTAQSLA
jgi:hypothetical protein